MIRPASLIAAFALVVAGPRPAPGQTADALFDPSVVQDVRLYLHGADWRALQAGYLDNTYYAADLLWRGVRVHNVGIRSRGYGTRDPRKPGLRIDMNHFVSGQRFLGLRAVILDNGLQDDSLLKERIAFRLFDRLGVAVAREAPARLYVNNVYWGAYVLVEEIDDDFLARATGAVAGDGVPYLFEYRWVRPYDFGYLGEDAAAYAELFEPRTRETESAAALYDPLRELTRRLADAEDDAFEEAVAPYLDLDQFVRIAAIENYLAEIDGLLGSWGMNNFYLYRPAGATRARLVPWDKDVAFHDVRHPLWFNVDGNVLMRRALRVPRLREHYLETVAACVELASAPAPGDPRGWLEREIDAGVQQIGASVQADPARPHAYAALVAEADRLTAFARARGPILRCAIADARGGPADPACLADARAAPGAAQKPIFRSAISGR